eukprot:Nitzschia sp. Nitz4//scaffold166_size90379//74449//76459//NITZ4_005070-RA/size90379-augustus-gene-0.17-mRNA-1//-1//CDS//3329538235//964//frame0
MRHCWNLSLLAWMLSASLVQAALRTRNSKMSRPRRQLEYQYIPRGIPHNDVSTPVPTAFKDSKTTKAPTFSPTKAPSSSDISQTSPPTSSSTTVIGHPSDAGDDVAIVTDDTVTPTDDDDDDTATPTEDDDDDSTLPGDKDNGTGDDSVGDDGGINVGDDDDTDDAATPGDDDSTGQVGDDNVVPADDDDSVAGTDDDDATGTQDDDATANQDDDDTPTGTDDTPADDDTSSTQDDDTPAGTDDTITTEDDDDALIQGDDDVMIGTGDDDANPGADDDNGPTLFDDDFLLQDDEFTTGTDDATDDITDDVTAATAVFCDGYDATSQVSALNWTYAVTMEDGTSVQDVLTAVETFEPLLLTQMIELLQCNQSDYGIIGMDVLPDDTILGEECPDTTSSLPCFVFQGSMDIYLEEEADESIAILESRRFIQNLLEEVGAVDVDNVVDIEYLSPDLSDTSPITGNEGGDRDATLGGDNRSVTVPVILSVGALFVAFAVVGAARYRRRENDLDGPTIASGGPSVATGNESGLTHDYDSNFLPGAYQTGTATMSAIPEDSSDSARNTNTSLIISDCGYTDDSSRDMSFVNTVLNEDPTLGARGIDDYEHDDDYIFDHEDFQP